MKQCYCGMWTLFCKSLLVKPNWVNCDTFSHPTGHSLSISPSWPPSFSACPVPRSCCSSCPLLIPAFYPASPQQTAGRRLGGSIHVSLAPCTICSHTMSSADKASSKKGLWGKACSVIKIVRTIHHNIYNIISSISFVVMSLMIKKSYEEFIF